jgi:hypothetical protein
MSRRVAKRRYDANAIDGVFAVFDENQAVLVGQQVLARGTLDSAASKPLFGAAKTIAPNSYAARHDS